MKASKKKTAVSYFVVTLRVGIPVSVRGTNGARNVTGRIIDEVIRARPVRGAQPLRGWKDFGEASRQLGLDPLPLVGLVKYGPGGLMGGPAWTTRIHKHRHASTARSGRTVARSEEEES